MLCTANISPHYCYIHIQTTFPIALSQDQSQAILAVIQVQSIKHNVLSDSRPEGIFDISHMSDVEFRLVALVMVRESVYDIDQRRTPHHHADRTGSIRVQ